MFVFGQKIITINSSNLTRFILLILIILTSAQTKSQTKNKTGLVNNIVINDTLVILPDKTNNSHKQFSINYNRNINSVIVEIDTTIIKKYSLIQFKYLAGANYQSAWTTFTVKDLLPILKNTTQITIESIDNNGIIYTDSFTIKYKNLFFKKYTHTFIYIITIIILIIIIIYFIDYKLSTIKYKLESEIYQRTLELVKQKEKYEEVLTNYLPKEEFEKLKEKDRTTRYKMVTVMFSNILGFTKIAGQDNADRLIDDLDRFFFEFDSVVQKLHIEKIKTVGDSYICAGGIPQKNRTNPIEVVLAAFEMQQYMQILKSQYDANNMKIWDLRMGIHTGPVFSNGSNNKKRLEIWGDTVNIASRLEASGEIGKVNISGSTYELVKDYFLCRYRGKMPVKYKGEIDMYFIEGFRPALSVDGIGVKPNQTFITRLGLIRFDDLEEEIMNMLDEKLPRNLYYHNLKHTIDVTVQVEIIGRQENITEEELLMLKTAALFHDTGFMTTYNNHEEAGAELAKKILPDFDYHTQQIELICSLIMVTKLPPKPKNLLEQIMCDADLDYLGRVDFIPVSGNLFRELTEHKLIEKDINKWNQMQIKFIENHQYFTESAKKMRDVNKNNQLEAIRRLVQENN